MRCGCCITSDSVDFYTQAGTKAALLRVLPLSNRSIRDNTKKRWVSQLGSRSGHKNIEQFWITHRDWEALRPCFIQMHPNSHRFCHLSYLTSPSKRKSNVCQFHLSTVFVLCRSLPYHYWLQYLEWCCNCFHLECPPLLFGKRQPKSQSQKQRNLFTSGVLYTPPLVCVCSHWRSI